MKPKEKQVTMNLDVAHVAAKCYLNPGNPPVVDAIPLSAKTVLDVGCGAGDNARLLRDRGCVVDGITLSESEAKTATNWCRNVVVADLEHGLPNLQADDHPYDAVLCSHVLEHLRWPQELLQQIRPRLSSQPPGTAQLVVALPNIMFYKTRFPLIWAGSNTRPPASWTHPISAGLHLSADAE